MPNHILLFRLWDVGIKRSSMRRARSTAQHFGKRHTLRLTAALNPFFAAIIAMDAFFDIAAPVPAEIESEGSRIPANYDTSSGSGSGSCTIV
ncbi:hypothetical protein DAEQUDRAFT_727734 [Daedalea quercina L-15889]|uniref:Uncharacterized protein n=1 Tax=Daedalea quercina L-15889 TaxID=1314783 RepID=A0A165PTT9_9APHY|nr:hypothetical protein DAEQUDRAFT_727734 [Daedalea quercina L-15889]